MSYNSAGNPKWGTGTLAGMMRQGIRELRGAMYTGSNVAQPTDLGIYGNSTPGEVAAARADTPQPDVARWESEGGSVLNDRMNQIEATRDVRGPQERGLEQGR